MHFSVADLARQVDERGVRAYLAFEVRDDADQIARNQMFQPGLRVVVVNRNKREPVVGGLVLYVANEENDGGETSELETFAARPTSHSASRALPRLRPADRDAAAALARQ